MAEYVEIILKNIEKSLIEEVFRFYVLFDSDDIRTSHFYDVEKDEEVSYNEIDSINEYFQTPGTCNLFLKKTVVGIELENVLLHIACDEKFGDITISFEEKQFEQYTKLELNSKMEKLLALLVEICQKIKAGEVVLGYEPADDADMKLLSITSSQIQKFNEDVFISPLASAIYGACSI